MTDGGRRRAVGAGAGRGRARPLGRGTAGAAVALALALSVSVASGAGPDDIPGIGGVVPAPVGPPPPAPVPPAKVTTSNPRVEGAGPPPAAGAPTLSAVGPAGTPSPVLGASGLPGLTHGTRHRYIGRR